MINSDEFGTGTVTAKKAEATSSTVYAIPDEERARQRAAEGFSAESEDIEEDLEDEVIDLDVPSLDR
jgi:predicted dehydrogenase